MAKNNAASAVVLCLILVSTSMPTSECSSIPAPVAREEDVQYIKCQVCEKLASKLYRQIPEEQINEIARNLCNLEEEEAVWIRKIDLVEKGDKLMLEEKNAEGYCNSECKTLQKACEEVAKDAEGICAEYLNSKSPHSDGMVDFLCKNATDACDSEPPPLPKDRTPGEAFMPKPSEEADVERKAKSSTESTPGAPRTNTYLMDESTNAKNSGEEDKDKGTHSHSKLVRGSSKEAPLPSETRKTEL
ncbi:uncharacterized protein LOC120291635 [Eucalyptus grandis]|uniref:uncharacterized protein LOC120291635 n=1 Tax=Eucalyptus grandis TaxID=71139 RepID=UPI00192EBC2B|nr:uncharacterized protein LOC120291635 [Eucalyptus grandis]